MTTEITDVEDAGTWRGNIDLSIEGEEESTSSRNHSIDLSDESATAMTICRDQIAEVMWTNYINVNP